MGLLALWPIFVVLQSLEVLGSQCVSNMKPSLGKVECQ